MPEDASPTIVARSRKHYREEVIAHPNRLKYEKVPEGRVKVMRILTDVDGCEVDRAIANILEAAEGLTDAKVEVHPEDEDYASLVVTGLRPATTEDQLKLDRANDAVERAERARLAELREKYPDV